MTLGAKGTDGKSVKALFNSLLDSIIFPLWTKTAHCSSRLIKSGVETKIWTILRIIRTLVNHPSENLNHLKPPCYITKPPYKLIKAFLSVQSAWFEINHKFYKNWFIFYLKEQNRLSQRNLLIASLTWHYFSNMYHTKPSSYY